MSVSPVSNRQRIAVAAILAYCVPVVILGFPREILPTFVHQQTSAARAKLDAIGINPWHFVFPGNRDHQKRRHIAVQYTGISRDGERTVLHEGPKGLTNPSVRVWESLRDTVSHKTISLKYGGRLMRRQSDKAWRDDLDTFLRSGRPDGLTRAFCDSALLHGGTDPEYVEMDLFVAGIDYDTGEQYGRAVKVLKRHCPSGRSYRPLGAPEDLPDWPNVEWRAIL